MTLPAFWCGYSIGSWVDHFCHKSLTPYSTPRAKGRIENIKMTAHIPAATLSTHCLQDRIIGAHSGCHRKQHKSPAPSEHLWIPRGFIEDFNIFRPGWRWLQWQWILPCRSTPSRTFLMATVFWTWIPLTKLFPSLTAAEFHLVRSVKSSWALWPAPTPQLTIWLMIYFNWTQVLTNDNDPHVFESSWSYAGALLHQGTVE